MRCTRFISLVLFATCIPLASATANECDSAVLDELQLFELENEIIHSNAAPSASERCNFRLGDPPTPGGQRPIVCSGTCQRADRSCQLTEAQGGVVQCGCKARPVEVEPDAPKQILGLH